METLGYVRAEDQLQDGASAPGGVLDITPLLGTWFATDKQASGIVKMVLSRYDGLFLVRAFGAGSPEPYDWGEVPATAYGAAVTAIEAMAFSAVYDFGFLTSVLAAYSKQGILVLDTFNTFKDSSGRSNYFSREFFHR
jgi:hypothetical protein